MALCSILSLSGCNDLITEPSLHQQSAAYTNDRISFAPVSLPVAPEETGAKQIASLLNVQSALNYGEFRWNEDGVPAGKTWVLVDLEAQTMSIFRGKDEIGTAVTLYGVDNKPTPVGRFKIIEKRKDHRSNLYDAPMPYMLRLTMDGVAIHGSDVREGAGTHGCLGVPIGFGQHLFRVLSVGDDVYIVRSGLNKRT